MYYFIINPKSRSGNGYHVWKLVKRQLEHNKIEYRPFFTQYPLHAVKIAQKICNQEQDKKFIVVIGGDGTMNEVINGIADYSHVILGYIPSGSGNDLARSLDISKNPLEALENLLNPKKFPYYDHGVIESLETPFDFPIRKFAVSTGIGLDASICYDTTHSKIKKILNKLRLGKLTYGLLALKQLFVFTPTNGWIKIDENPPIELKQIIFIASMIHPFEGGGFKMAPWADPSDQKLFICIFHNISKLKAFLFLPTILWGKHLKIKGVKTLNCHTLEIFTQKEFDVHTDGEYIGKTHHVKISSYPDQISIAKG